MLANQVCLGEEGVLNKVLYVDTPPQGPNFDLKGIYLPYTGIYNIKKLHLHHCAKASHQHLNPSSMQGRSQDFSKGRGRTGSNIIVIMAFSP